MPQPLCDGVGVSLISLTVVHDFDVKQFFGIFWSLVPYAFLACLIFGTLFTQRMSLVVFTIFGLIMAAINEFAVKNIHDETRPPHSCLDSGGFPSGHAMISTLYLTWCTLEFIIHPVWTVRKKVISLVALWALLAPCPPFRHVGGDHSWTQIAAGIVVGFVAGLILFFFNQFVIVRNLESIMNWRITKFLHIQNDLRPNYEHSKNHGAKASEQTSKVIPTKGPRVTSMAVFNFAHVLPILIWFILGILGIILGLVKKHDSPCNRSSGPMVIGVGVWTLLAALFATAIYMLALRKINKQTWFPEAVQGMLFAFGILLTMGLFWNVAGVETSREDDDCRHSALTLAYAVVWFVANGILFVFICEMYFLLDVRHIYGFRKNCHYNSGVNEIAPQDVSQKVAHESATAPTGANAV